MTNEEILAILRQYPDLVPEVLAILTEAPAKTDLESLSGVCGSHWPG